MLNELLKSVLSETAASAVYPQDIFASIIDFGDEAAAPLRKEDMPSFAGVITKEDRLPSEGMWVSSPSQVSSIPCQSAPSTASSTPYQSAPSSIVATRKPHALKVSIETAERDLQPWVRPENFERMILPLPYPTKSASTEETDDSSEAKNTGTRPMWVRPSLLGGQSH